MNNSSSVSNWTSVEYMKRADWIAPIAVHVFLILSTAWIISSLIHFGIKNKKWKRTTNQNNFEKLSSGWIYSSVLLCAAICLLRFVITLSILNIGYEKKDDFLCSVLSDLQSSFYALVQLSVLFFLWLRQRAFYVNAMLAVSYTKPVRYFSLTSIALILISGVGITVFSTLPDDRRASSNGCIQVSDGSSRIGYWVFLALVIVFVHGILFGLFYHAIRKSRDFSKRSSYSLKQRNPKAEQEQSSEKSQDTSSKELSSLTSGGPKTVSSAVNTSEIKKPADSNAAKGKRRSSSKSRKSKHPIKRTLQKTFLFAIISVLADIFLSIIWLFIKVDGRLVVTFYNMNVLVSLLLVIFSFTPYKKMLFSFC